jgi:hypothetical protein
MEIDNISLKNIHDFNTCYFALKVIEGVGFDKPQLGNRDQRMCFHDQFWTQDLQEQWLGRIRKNRLYIFIE